MSVNPARWVVVGLFVVAASGCGGGGSDGGGIVDAQAVTSVVVSPNPPGALDPTDVVQLTAAVTVQNNAPQTVTWKSSDDAVATVSGSGLVTGVSAGTAVITATSTFNPNRSGSTTVTVNPAKVTAVTLNTGDRSLRVRDNFALVATVATKGTIAKTVTFTAAPTGIVTITSADNINATVTGVAAGETTVTATSTGDPSKSQSIRLTVSGTVSITVNPSSVSVLRNTTTKITPTVTPDPNVSGAITFESQDTQVATVASDGTVTGVGLGNTNIIIHSVGDPTVQVSVPVTVRSGVTSLTVAPQLDTLRPNLTHQLAVTVTTESGAISQGVVYTSLNPAVVTTDQTGRITGVALGLTYVRASSAIDASKRDSVKVVVVDPCLIYPTVTVGGPPSAGTISDASCAGVTEKVGYRITQPTALRLIASWGAFPASLTYLATRTEALADGQGSSLSYDLPLFLGPGDYRVQLDAASTASRGAYSIGLANFTSLQGHCVSGASTGTTGSITASNLTLGSECAYQPKNRPAGTYYGRRFVLIPLLSAGQTWTITVNAGSGIAPLIDVTVNGFFTSEVAAAGTATSVATTFTSNTFGVLGFVVSSRDPGQTGTFSVTIDGPATAGTTSSARTRQAIELPLGTEAWPPLGGEAARPPAAAPLIRLVPARP